MAIVSREKIRMPLSDADVHAAISMAHDAVMEAGKRVNLESAMQIDFDVRSLRRFPESYNRQHIPNLALAAEGLPSNDYLDQWRLEGPG